MENFIDGTGQDLIVHDKGKCKGEYCCIHNPSDHHMVDWPLYWRSDRCFFERIDPEGVGHPDPDEIKFHDKHGNNISVHGCNGLCHPENYKNYCEDMERKSKENQEPNKDIEDPGLYYVKESYDSDKDDKMIIDWKEEFIYFLEQKNLLLDYISLVEYCNYHPYSKVLDNLDPNEYILKGFDWGESNNYHLWEFVDTEWVDYYNYWKYEDLTNEEEVDII